MEGWKGEGRRDERVCRDARLHLSALQRWEEKRGWREMVEKQVEGVKEHGNREEGRRIQGKNERKSVRKKGWRGRGRG